MPRGETNSLREKNSLHFARNPERPRLRETKKMSRSPLHNATRCRRYPRQESPRRGHCVRDSRIHGYRCPRIRESVVGLSSFSLLPALESKARFSSRVSREIFPRHRD